MKLRTIISLTIVLLFLPILASSQTAEQIARAKVLFEQGLADHQRKQYDAAIVNFAEYVKIRPNIAEGWYNLGLSRYYKTQASPSEAGYRQAAADVSQAIMLNGKTAVYWHVRGGIYSQLLAVDFVPSRDRAIADYTEAIRLDPKYAASFRERGIVYERVNRMREALADLNTAIRLDPQDATAHYTRAKVHGSQKNYAAARRDAETAIRLFPNYTFAKNYLTYITNEERKATTVAQKLQPTRTATPRPRPTPPASRPPTAVPSATTDLNHAFQLARAAEAARNHRQTVAHATRTLELLPMAGPTQPRDDLMLSVFMNTLEMRARAYSGLGDNARSDADYERAAKATMDATQRYLEASNAALDRDTGSSGAGLIRSVLETGSAVIYCTSGLKTASEWVDTVNRTRPNVRSDSFKAVLTMAGVRELCLMAHIAHAGGKAAQSALRLGDSQKVYAESLAILEKAIAMMPNYVAIYRERARIHRRFERADLAAADERRIRELEAEQSRPRKSNLR